MFLSMKRKFSSAILNTVILLTFVFCCYLGKQVTGSYIIHLKLMSVMKVGELYQQYQKAARLQSYLEDLEQLLMNTERLRSGAEGLRDQFVEVKGAVQGSLSLDLKHET